MLGTRFEFEANRFVTLVFTFVLKFGKDLLTGYEN